MLFNYLVIKFPFVGSVQVFLLVKIFKKGPLLKLCPAMAILDYKLE